VRDIHDFGDLLVLETFDVGVVHDHPEWFWQSIHRCLNRGGCERDFPAEVTAQPTAHFTELRWYACPATHNPRHVESQTHVS
jgi:hypothetical protein